jgi:hypothetical protein
MTGEKGLFSSPAANVIHDLDEKSVLELPTISYDKTSCKKLCYFLFNIPLPLGSSSFLACTTRRLISNSAS